jgi:hypothetical protein
LTLGGIGSSSTNISGNNTFTELASTKTVSHGINLALTTQRVGAFTITGTFGNPVVIANTAYNLIYTGLGSITGLDYLQVSGRVYGPNGETNNIWFAGSNSTNSGSLGWEFSGGLPPTINPFGNFFLMFE